MGDLAAAPKAGAPGTGRAGGLGLVLTVVAAGGTLSLAALTVGSWPGSGVVATEQALLPVALGAATGLAGWVAGVLALASAAVLREAGGHRPPSPAGGTMPRSVRWTCAALVALSGSTSLAAWAAPPVEMSTSPATPFRPVLAAAAHASTPAPPPTSSADDSEPAVPQPGWTPTPRTPPPAPPDGVGLVSSAPREGVADRVVVRRGDTLWDISARHLGPGATTADIAEAWPRWYAANADLIGPDPDLILPGQELVVPTRGTDR